MSLSTYIALVSSSHLLVGGPGVTELELEVAQAGSALEASGLSLKELPAPELLSLYYSLVER